MGTIAFFTAVVSTALFAAVCGPFLRALESEAPAVYASLGSPTVGSYLWNRRVFMPFSSMILFRGYREQLAPFPKSRAWASWLFVAHWLQLVALGWFLVTLFDLGNHDF